ncbi:MAG: prolipoprotein diacylglyceryl transferase [Thermoanaerobaculia bacterium]
MYPKLISFDGFFIPTYGFFLFTGVVLALLLGKKLAKMEGLDGEKVVDMAISILIFSFLGSKILLLFTDFSYLSSWEGIWALLRSGGVFYGGLVFGFLVALFYIKKYKFPLGPLADIYGICIPFAHFFGRLGCFFAGCCWGKSCSLPWAVTFKNTFTGENMGTPLNQPLHPTQLYEAFFLLFLFFILRLYFYRRRIFKGQVFLLYVLFYAIFRFFIEFLRDDPRGYVFDLISTSQFFSIIAFIFSIFLYARNYKKSKN